MASPLASIQTASPAQFYDARDASRLEAVFEDIRGKISRLRISR